MAAARRRRSALSRRVARRKARVRALFRKGWSQISAAERTYRSERIRGVLLFKVKLQRKGRGARAFREFITTRQAAGCQVLEIQFFDTCPETLALFLNLAAHPRDVSVGPVQAPRISGPPD